MYLSAQAANHFPYLPFPTCRTGPICLSSIRVPPVVRACLPGAVLHVCTSRTLEGAYLKGCDLSGVVIFKSPTLSFQFGRSRCVVQKGQQRVSQDRKLYNKLSEFFVSQQEGNMRLSLRQQDIPDGFLDRARIRDPQNSYEVVYVFHRIADDVETRCGKRTQRSDVVLVRDGVHVDQESRETRSCRTSGGVEGEVVEEVDQDLKDSWLVFGQIDIGSAILLR
jgi:hypothetical protein